MTLSTHSLLTQHQEIIDAWFRKWHREQQQRLNAVFATKCTCGGDADQPASHHDISCPAALAPADGGSK